MRNWLAFGLVVLVGGAVSAAEGSGRADSQRSKVAAVEAQISAKRALIRSSWKEVARLDHLIAQTTPAPNESAIPSEDSQAGEALSEALLEQAFQRESLESQRRQALQGILAAYREVGYMEEEIRAARSQLGRKPLLEGEWSLTFLPNGARGQVSLTQNGTLLEGVYSLESGLTGNLTGTFINGQVTLERIDSKFGKMGRLDGELSKDGVRIRGTWYSYDLQSGNPLTGSFTLDQTDGGSSTQGTRAPGEPEGGTKP